MPLRCGGRAIAHVAWCTCSYGIDDDALAAGDAPPDVGAAAEHPAAPAASCSTPGDGGGKRARAALAADGNGLGTSPLKPAAPPQPRRAAGPTAARAPQLRCITNALAARAQPGSSSAREGGATSKAPKPMPAGVRKLTSLSAGAGAEAASATSSAGPRSQPPAASSAAATAASASGAVTERRDPQVHIADQPAHPIPHKCCGNAQQRPPPTACTGRARTYSPRQRPCGGPAAVTPTPRAVPCVSSRRGSCS